MHLAIISAYTTKNFVIASNQFLPSRQCFLFTAFVDDSYKKEKKWNKTKSAKRKDLVTIVPLSNLRGQCRAVQDLSGNSVFAHEREHLLGIGLCTTLTHKGVS